MVCRPLARLLALLAVLLPAPLAAQGTAGSVERRLPVDRNEVVLSYAPVVREVAPAVVNIYTAKRVEIQGGFANPFFQRFFGNDLFPGMPRERIERSLGSGVIVRADGVIVTNNHVIGDADVIKVVLADRREYDAEILLADPRTDLAVLRLSGENLPTDLPVARLAARDDSEVGDIVLAIGNPFGIGQTVTSGIISATARTQIGVNDYGFFLQTDAAVNPGNSGGALVNLTGDLIGINTAIFSRTGDTSGIGFAIPSSMVRTVLNSALEGGEIVRSWIGISGRAVDAEMARALGLDRPGGVLVNDIYPGGAAERAGIEPGDILLAVAGEDILDERALRFRVATHGVGERVMIDLLRGGERLEREVEIDALPETPERNVTVLEGRHPFQLVKIGNLSPRFAEEIGLDPMRRGVVVLEIDRRAPAGRFGYVRPGDLLIHVQDVRIDRVEDVVALAGQPWETWSYRVRRGAELIDCTVFKNGAIECRRAADTGP